MVELGGWGLTGLECGPVEGVGLGVGGHEAGAQCQALTPLQHMPLPVQIGAWFHAAASYKHAKRPAPTQADLCARHRRGQPGADECLPHARVCTPDAQRGEAQGDVAVISLRGKEAACEKTGAAGQGDGEAAHGIDVASSSRETSGSGRGLRPRGKGMGPSSTDTRPFRHQRY